MMSLNGVVAAAHPLAAQAGSLTLARGGNAFDAAAAVAAALNVVEPFMSGLAGLGLATIWVAAERRVRVLDFVGAVPRSFPAERFTARAELDRGPLAVMPPANLAGWCELVRAHGRLGLAEIFAPAIALAETGFPLAEFGCEETNDAGALLAPHPALREGWAAHYLPGGAPVSPGTVLRQPDLARTLRALAADGPDLLYRGALGQAIVEHLAGIGGTLTVDDLAAVKPVWREPLRFAYRGLDVHVPPPPCEGFQFALTMRILEGFDLAALERDGIEHLDLVLRAIRVAAGERIAHILPDAATLGRLFSDAHVEALRARVRDGRPVAGATEQWMAPPPGQDHAEDPGHTTSFSIGDRDGNLVCVTQSLGSPFGSGVVVPGTGVCLNNFLFWADVQPESPNRTRPGDLLPICVSPTISTRGGEAVLALGTPGSYGILQTQAQAMVQLVDFGPPLQAAIDAPRARLWDGRLVDLEPRLDPGLLEPLTRRGHEARWLPQPWSWKVGGMQAVARDPATGVMTGAADPRRDGGVALAP